MIDDYADYFEDNDGRERTAPYVKGSVTSETAARGQKRDKVRDTVIRILTLYATGDFTRDEALLQLDREGNDYSGITPRFTHCVDAGCLVGTGVYRKTSRGRMAEVLRLVPGATIATFDAWWAGQKPSILSLAKWRKALEKASLAYAADPTPAKQTALLQIAMAGAKFPAPVRPRSAVARTGKSAVKETQDENIDPMDWAMGR